MPRKPSSGVRFDGPLSWWEAQAEAYPKSVRLEAAAADREVPKENRDRLRAPMDLATQGTDGRAGRVTVQGQERLQQDSVPVEQYAAHEGCPSSSRKMVLAAVALLSTIKARLLETSIMK